MDSNQQHLSPLNKRGLIEAGIQAAANAAITTLSPLNKRGLIEASRRDEAIHS